MLQKKEIIYRHLLDEYLDKRCSSFTQLELSKRFAVSLSTVSNALIPLREMGIIEVKARSFALRDAKKLLLYFATTRNLAKDQLYATRYDAPVMEIEKLVPADAMFGAFSAYRLTFKDSPADYSEVYVYADPDALKEIKKRFPQKAGPPNIIVLEADPFISKGKVSRSQLYVDLWNLKSWYAKEFLDAVEKRLFG